MQDAVSDTMITDINTESTIPESQITQDDAPMTRMVEIIPEPATRDAMPSTPDAPAPMLADASVGWASMMMALPEGDTLAKTSTAMPVMTATPPTTTESPSPDTSSDISSEIQDMVWEINAIINEAWSTHTLTLPDYPVEMPIYTKETWFTTEEITLLAGSGITSTIVSTYSPDILEGIIIERRGTMTLTGTPTVRYISHKKWNQSILVPTVIYTTTAWTTLEVALVPGY
jgi:hypothetical protein